jgi:tight adherence protein C
MSEPLILLAVFASVLLIVFTVASVVARNRAISRNIEDATAERSSLTSVDDMLATDNEAIRYYMDIQRTARPDSVEMRLVAAGYFNRSAPRYYMIGRFVAAVAGFVIGQIGMQAVAPGASGAVQSLFAVILGGVFFILSSAVLDSLVSRAEITNRKLFPDFMDLLIVCVDAGLSIEAAIDRVAREFLQAKPGFGTQLAIISLEVRAGRPLHEALMNFAERIKLEEARTLATLFRQSQELGASVVRTLRTYSKEMRQTRIIKAEEKANALPIKMLFPLATFMFPVNLLIVLIPVMMLLMNTFRSMTPPSL